VTAKDEVLIENYISPMYGPLTVLVVLLGAGLVAIVVRWIAFPGDHAVLRVVGGWAVFNFLLVGASWRAVAEKQQRRTAPRVEMAVPASVSQAETPDGSPSAAMNATILDVSTSGVRVMLLPTPGVVAQDMARIVAGDVVLMTPSFPKSPQLEFPLRLVVRSVARQPAGTVLGCEFHHDAGMAARETVAHLIFGDSRNWQAIRAAYSAPKGLIAGFWYVLGLAFRGIPGTISDMAKEPARRRRAAYRLLHEDSAAEVPAHLLAFGRFTEVQSPAPAPKAPDPPLPLVPSKPVRIVS
jgi:cellulose synthase (UDP-forming)